MPSIESDRVRIGVVGCGAIAQVQHLPNLLELADLYDVVGVCDASARLAEYAAQRFWVPRHTTNLADLLADVDAVLLCHTDPKIEAAIAAFAAGKHVLVEKPVCTSLPETEALVAAAEASGRVGQAAYMKVYDPAFEVARREVAQMGDDILFVQIHHLHPDNELHLRQFDVRRFDDIPAALLVERRDAYQARLRESLGDLFDTVEPACGVIHGLIHDLYSLRAMLGVPCAVLSVEVWSDHRAVTVVLQFPNGARCVITRADLRQVWDFKETLEIYGHRKRVLLSYPTGFSRRVLSQVVIQGIDAEGESYRREPVVPWESAFVAELRHFHECITRDVPCRTPITDVRQDVALIGDILRVYGTRQPLQRKELT